VKNYGIIPDFDLFLQGKTVDRVHGLWTAQGWSVHGGLTTGRRAHRSVAPGGAHRGLRWPIRRRGEAGGGEE
jgi:hypothetical protein